VGTFPTPVHQWSGQTVASTSSSLHSSTWKTFLTDFEYVWYLHKRTLWQSHVCLVAYSGHFCFWGDLTKLVITIAGVDRLYWNLTFCLQLDAALLLQNFAKIRHCLPKLWKCIQWFTFFRTQRRTEIICRGYLKLNLV